MEANMITLPTKTDMIHDEYYILAAYNRALQRGLSPEQAREALAHDPDVQDKILGLLFSEFVYEVCEEEYARQSQSAIA
jgi:hypothetical protein